MKRRVFIAINLPEDLREKLVRWQELHQNLPVRWTKPGSLHITLVFIGYITEDQLWQICQLIREVTSTSQPFYIKLNKILSGPPGRPPRMIWIEGEASKEMAKLKEGLEKALLERPWGGSFRKENRALRPHITLARFSPPHLIRADRRRRSNLRKALIRCGGLPLAEEDFNYSFAVNSIELMESNLKRDGAEYMVLESFELGETESA